MVQIINAETAGKTEINATILTYGIGGENGSAIEIVNNSNTEGTDINSTISARIGDIIVSNTTDKLLVEGMMSNTENGNIKLTNSGALLEITGKVSAEKGNIDIINDSVSDDAGIKIDTTALVSGKNGTVNVLNTGAEGITLEGYIKGNNSDVNITNKNSDITIGEYTSDNDKYIDVTGGNVVITQTDGYILNGIVDESNSIHTYHDLANPNHSYKTLISTTNDLVMNVTDGDIGVYSNQNIAPGCTVDATTRDYTESVNVNVGGRVVAKALNDTLRSTRLINIRAKESGLNLKEVKSDGDVVITAADWKQPDVNPAPEDEGYFKGYSILSSADGTPAISGQNISVISSDNIGNENKKLTYYQDSLANPNSSVSFEAENDISISGEASKTLTIRQIISKRGTIDFDADTDADIGEITSGKGLKITQKAQNLTIRNIGTRTSGEDSERFNDILYHHDGIAYGGGEGGAGSIVPEYLIIKVLDAKDTPERAESNLIIYSAYVKGNNGENAHYYPDGTRLADVTLMADNIYANSYKAVNSKVHTKDNPRGVNLNGRTYSNEDIDSTDTNIYEAKGINAYGEGEALSFDILGVDADTVHELVPAAQRDYYIVETSKTKVPKPFINKNDRTKFYGYDFVADNVYLSVNDYSETD